jgi:zinc transporter 7
MEAFTVGALLGDVFFHSIPHMVEHAVAGKHYELSDTLMNMFMLVTAGVFLCYLIEALSKALIGEHSHDEVADEKASKQSHKKKGKSAQTEVLLLQKPSHSHNKKASTFTSLVGDLSHNFTDGVAIAATYSLNTTLGITTTIAILIHEIPHEIGDFAMLFKSGYGFFKIIGFQLLTALGALAGTYVGLAFGEVYMVEGVALASGGFIYMALCIFMEDLRHKSSVKGAFLNTIFAILGLFFMYCVGALE